MDNRTQTPARDLYPSVQYAVRRGPMGKWPVTNETNEAIEGIPTLKKPHIMWAPTTALWQSPEYRATLTHILRIAGVVPVSCHYNTESDFAVAAELAQELSLPVAVHLSPYYRHMPNIEGFTTGRLAVETNFWRLMFAIIESNIPIDRIKYVVLDCECFHTDSTTTDNLIAAAHTYVYDFCKVRFGEHVTIDWFGRGGVSWSAWGADWRNRTLHTLREPGDSLSCEIDWPGEYMIGAEKLRRTISEAQYRGFRTVVPWVSLGAGWQHRVDRGAKKTWQTYGDAKVAWQWGRELNNDHGVTVPRVILYPAIDPFMDSAGVNAIRHFYAYAKGSDRDCDFEIPERPSSSSGGGVGKQVYSPQ